jgi:hypothetical protein
VFLQAELPVGRLAAALAAIAVHFGLELEGGGGTDFVDVTTGEAGAVGAVPVFLKEH